jgi:hypothetical protein
MELLFEICMSFNSKYDWRAFLEEERKDSSSSPTPPHGSGPKTPKLEPEYNFDKWLDELEKEASGMSAHDTGGSSTEGPSDNLARHGTITDAKVYELAIKRLRADYNAWKSNARMKPETKKKRMEETEAYIKQLSRRMKALPATASA